jgi:hypothetical protein
VSTVYCTACGTPATSGEAICSRCGAALPQLDLPPPPPAPPARPWEAEAGREAVPNYLTQAIVTTICCCWPFAIPAIYAAADVNFHLGAGDLGKAREASKKARTWCWVAFGVGAGFWVLYLLFSVVVGLSGEL